MSMEYRMRRTLPDDRVAIIMPVDHGLIFSRLPGLESPAKVNHRTRATEPARSSADAAHPESD